MGGRDVDKIHKIFILLFFFYIDYNGNGLLDYDEILGGIITLGNASMA